MAEVQARTSTHTAATSVVRLSHDRSAFVDMLNVSTTSRPTGHIAARCALKVSPVDEVSSCTWNDIMQTAAVTAAERRPDDVDVELRRRRRRLRRVLELLS